MRRPPEPAARKCPAGTSGPSAGHSMALRLPWESGMACVPVRAVLLVLRARLVRAPAQAAEATPARASSAATGPGTEGEAACSSCPWQPLLMPRRGHANAPGGTRLKLRSREERSSALITSYTLCH